MSQENVEVMRAAIEAFNRRDGEGFGAFLADDAEIVPVRAALEGTIYRGRDAAAQYCAAVEESWEDLRWEVEEIRDGESWVLALGRIQGRGRGSGADFDAKGAWLARFRDGLVTHFRTYPDRGEALEAVAMSEEHMELARRVFENRNVEEIDEMEIRSIFHADVEFVPQRAGTEGAYRGIAGIEKFRADTEQVFEKFDVDYELLDLGERVLAWGKIDVRARGSGIEVDVPMGGVFEFRDGKIVRWEDFGSKDKALEAVALKR